MRGLRGPLQSRPWYASLSEEARTNPPMVLTPEREAEILAAWKAR